MNAVLFEEVPIREARRMSLPMGRRMTPETQATLNEMRLLSPDAALRIRTTDDSFSLHRFYTNLRSYIRKHQLPYYVKRRLGHQSGPCLVVYRQDP